MEAAREGAAWFVAFYLMITGPLYRNALARQGFKKEVEAVLAANAGRKPAIVPPEADVLLEQLTIYGTPEIAQNSSLVGMTPVRICQRYFWVQI